ncbi:ABC transporter transmembrane domain-containing protein [Saccharothrix australiensis]|uniref:ABC-type multidrug transport system fused ATPase/permease subunit n=1 Tax=Saccharothrix australiensis TaxID=2072 RepID=A0A495VYL9_9PSEU|nr:ABC transporter ATP-binding protein [Saccharothrix australiensis]RKT53847.1 ABC-type multidrug transport system fused ATPase/permease subunit [Saccharothrix australiensis]
MGEAFTAPRPADVRGPGRFLWWLVAAQRRRVALGALLGSSWMVSLAVPPYLLAHAIDDGLVAGDAGALAVWVAALLGAGVLSAALAVARHRTMTKVRMDASFRTIRAVVRHSAHLGATLGRRVDAGEVVAIGVADVQVIAQSLTVTGPGVGAVVAYVAVAAVVLSISPPLALVVLCGVPLLAVTVGPLLRRIERTGAGYREHQGALTTRLVDVLDGLRVLNGLGGKDRHAARFGAESRELCERGYRVGAAASWVGALAGGLPALFLAVVTWLAARPAATGAITVGDLVAVHGYVAVLVVPVAFFIEGGGDVARAVTAARRVVRLLALTHDHADDPAAVAAPPSPATLRDPGSGVEVAPHRLTALVSSRAADAAEVVDRLGRFARSAATWAGAPLAAVPLGRVRDRILVADHDAELFAGSVREVVAGRRDVDDDAVRAALHAAVATDVVAALPGGLDARITAHGHNLSGGQRQRVRLARALCADAEVLLAVEPTSALDAHTEATLISRLRAAREGRTTLVTTTSPLVLDQVDVVVYLVDGAVRAVGAHRDLLRSEPGYRALVSRGVAEEAVG